MERATAPTAWATPSQRDATACPSAPKVRATGPVPLRTARGAGRLDDRERRFVEPRADAALPRAVRLDGRLELVLRDRVLELDFVPPREARERDVFELRDPGGEDVRVAMW